MIGKISRGSSFSSAIEYAFAAKKKAVLVYANMVEALESATNLKPLIKAFDRQANFYSQKTANPVYKVAFSPPEGTILAQTDWHQLCANFLKEFNLEGHQAVAVMHQDTYYPGTKTPRNHIHLIVNAVSAVGQVGNFFTITQSSIAFWLSTFN